jgi:hypothetical protein
MATRIVCTGFLLLLLAPNLIPGAERADSSAATAPQSLTAAPADLAIAARDAAAALAYEKQAAERTIKAGQTNLEQIDKQLPQLREAAEKGSKQEKERLARSEDRRKQLEADIAVAKVAVPRKEAEAQAAKTQADKLRAEAIEADRMRAAKQDYRTVAVKIDALLDSQLKSAGIVPAAPADDAEFLRRVTLDLCGTVPKYEDVTAFLADASPDKRAAAVGRLLSDPAYGRHFSQRFCTVTTEIGTSTLNQSRDLFNDWLAECLNLNRGWDRIVAELVASDGRGYERPAALFTIAYRMNEQPDPALLLGAAGDHFLGLQIQCVQCHDHPYHEWRHDEFWQMAALFGRVRLKGNVQQNRELDYVLTDDDVDPKELVRMNGITYPAQMADGKIGVPDPVNAGKDLRTVSAQFLDGSRPTLPTKGNYRTAFARWLTADENPYFARATVNRIWSYFFGRGIVEPLLNLHPDNEPTHPELLALLAEEFRRSDYDLKHVMRCLTATRAYGRTSGPIDPRDKDNKLLGRMAVKPLDSYVVVDSLAAVLRRPPPTGQRRREEAAVFDTRLPGGDPTKYTHGIPQVLRMLNAKEHSEFNSAVQTATRDKKGSEAIAQIYLAVLARRPTTDEAEQMSAYVDRIGDFRQAYADIFWVLLNSAEFLVNH